MNINNTENDLADACAQGFKNGYDACKRDILEFLENELEGEREIGNYRKSFVDNEERYRVLEEIYKYAVELAKTPIEDIEDPDERTKHCLLIEVVE